MLNLQNKPQQGYIALISAIVMSALLLTIAVSVGFSGLFGRLNLLDSESKETSYALAESCVDTAIYNVAQNVNYIGAVSIGKNTCNIISVTPSGNQTIIKTQAIFNKAYTDLKVTIDSSTFTITSFEECISLTSC